MAILKYETGSLHQSHGETKSKLRARADHSHTDKAIRKIHKLSTEMMNGDGDAALRWLNSPKWIFGGKTPMEHVAAEAAGASDVEQLIGRIRHGVFS